ncbi:MAG: LysR family transcriptional regulator [Sphingobium sp.]|nr:LysR family transcriptional regulator [Sphingobium sp.]MBP8670393.1 LysR family transcriptional regulator [Sphingobium sp.]MBP9157523.1 LysR family transcriptional regulator [Sphingobium sp.]MCC6482457.1 LysR family transcriptional regulator [Sphingomonadaceae bacterium]
MAGWDGIDEFVAVAKAGSFVGGARVLGKSNTHMSRAVALLETRLQAQLLYRTTRAVKLTDSGSVFFEQCERMIQERDEAVAIVSERGEPQGELRIASTTMLGEHFIVPLAQRYAREHPKMSVAVELSNRQFDLVGEGFDLAVRAGHLPDSRLIATRIAYRSLHTCASPAYLAQYGTPLTIEDLEAHDGVIGTGHIWQFSDGRTEKLFKPKGRWRCNSGYAVLRGTLAGMGVCQLPDFYVQTHLNQGTLISLLEEFAPPHEPVWAVYPQQRHLLPKVRSFVDLLKNELQSCLDRGYYD